MPSHHLTARRPVAPVVLLVAVCGGALALRWPALGESLWLDELHTSWVVAGSIDEIPQRARMGNNSPWYFYLVGLSTWLGGASEWSLRAPSLLAGMALIVVTYVVVRRWCDAPLGLLAAALVALDPHMCFYATEARVYALLQLVSLLHLAGFVSLLASPGERPPSRWLWVGWTASGIVLFHLHVTSALVFGAEAAVLAVLGWRRIPTALGMRAACGSLCLLLGSAVFCVGLLQTILSRRTNWELFVPRWGLAQIPSVLPLDLYLLIPLVAGGLYLVWKPREERASRPAGRVLVACLAWILVPLVSAWLLTQTDAARLFYRRYLLASSAALAPCAALCLARYVPSRRVTLVVGVLLLGVAGLRIATPRRGEDWRLAVALVNQTPSQAPLLLHAGLIESVQLQDAGPETLVALRAYCAFPVTGLYPLSPARPVVSLPPSGDFTLAPEIRQQLQAHGGSLLVRGERRFRQTRGQVQRSLGGEWSLGLPRAVGGKLRLVPLVRAPTGEPPRATQ